MKVVLFCGGYGMRMRVGPRPLLWHVMRYCAHFGYKDFILCLGYGGHPIKRGLPGLPGNRVERLRAAGRAGGTRQQRYRGLVDHVRRHRSRVADRERLRRVRRLLEGEEMFRANYADVLTDAPLDAMVAPFAATPDAGITPWMPWRSDRSNPAAAEVTVPVLGAAAR
jgi:glucose-1-phosphate cytidylyltransferase